MENQIVIVSGVKGKKVYLYQTHHKIKFLHIKYGLLESREKTIAYRQIQKQF